MTDTIEDQSQDSILGHIQDLVLTIKWLLFFIFLGAGASYIFSGQVIQWLVYPFHEVMGPDKKMIFVSPFEKIWVHLRVSFLFGIFFTSPGIFWSVFRFISPALKEDHRKTIWIMSITSITIFALGILFARQYTIPLLLKALINFKTQNENPLITLSLYVDMALGAALATALLLELPVMMFFLAKLGWISSQSWQKSRRMAIVVNAAMSAILSPPDPMSMFVLMIPIQILFECGILAAKMAESFSKKN